MAKSSALAVKLDAHTQERLQALGALRDRSPHYLMKAAIESFLDREEAYEREKQGDLERYERYELTGEAIPQAQALNWLDSLAEGQPQPRPR